MTKRSKITLREFNLVSTAIKGLLLQTEGVRDIKHSCIVFSCLGAAIVNQHFKIQCQPVAGAWLLRHPDGENILGFGIDDNKKFRSSEDGFHMWVETKTHAIDFTSAMYPEVFASVHADSPVPRAMVQIDLQGTTPTKDDRENWTLLRAIPNVDLTESFIDTFASNSENNEIIKILLQWIQLLKRSPNSNMKIINNSGRIVALRRSGFEARGIWRGPTKEKLGLRVASGSFPTPGTCG